MNGVVGASQPGHGFCTLTCDQFCRTRVFSNCNCG
jgi:hypothetical protein